MSTPCILRVTGCHPSYGMSLPSSPQLEGVYVAPKAPIITGSQVPSTSQQSETQIEKQTTFGCVRNAGEDFLVASCAGAFVGGLQCALQPWSLHNKAKHMITSALSLGVITGGWTITCCAATALGLPGWSSENFPGTCQNIGAELASAEHDIKQTYDESDIDMEWDFSAWDMKDAMMQDTLIDRSGSDYFEEQDAFKKSMMKMDMITGYNGNIESIEDIVG